MQYYTLYTVLKWPFSWPLILLWRVMFQSSEKLTSRADVLSVFGPAGGRLVQQEMMREFRDWWLWARSRGPTEDKISQAASS